MDLGLRDRVAVVAASSGGIGRAVAQSFAEEGARVVVNGRRSEIVEATAATIRESTRAQVLTVVSDVSTSAGCVSLIERSIAEFGTIHCLFTNAGGPPSMSFEDLSDEDWEAGFQLTLMSAVRLIRAALPALRETRGSIVNLTSIAAKRPEPSLTLSNALRPAVMGLSKTLSEDLAADGIRVNDVGPGLIWTDRQKYLTGVRAERAGIDRELEAANRAQNVPLGRFGLPEEVARLAVFLASPAAAYITGTSTLVDGGLYRGLI